MSEGPSAAARETSTAMTSLPSIDDLVIVEHGYEEVRVREAFDSFRRHAVQLQAQLRVLQAAGRTAQVDPTGHAVRMDALHLIREAAEFADVLERDAQRASRRRSFSAPSRKYASVSRTSRSARATSSGFAKRASASGTRS